MDLVCLLIYKVESRWWLQAILKAAPLDLSLSPFKHCAPERDRPLFLFHSQSPQAVWGVF